MKIQRKSQAYPLLLLSLLTVIGHFFSFVWFIYNARQGRISGGEMIMGVQALVLAQREIGLFMQNLSMLTQTLLFFDKFKRFLTIGVKNNSSPVSLSAMLEEKDKSRFRDEFCNFRQGNILRGDRGENYKKRSEEPIDFIPHIADKQFQRFNYLRLGIEFKNVSFCYSDGRIALKQINLHIQWGKKIALVGENGAGKSTFIKLLLGFYEPSEGSISIDGTDLKKMDLDSWRKNISAVFQDFGQYQMTIAENIGIADVGCMNEDELIKQAAHLGGFYSTAESLPHKYQTLLGKEFGGTGLSEGQWQKLALSRACMKDASILILDEPTAALDPKSEYELFQNLLRFLKIRLLFSFPIDYLQPLWQIRSYSLKQAKLSRKEVMLNY